MEKSLFAQAAEIKGREKEGFLVFTFQFTPSNEEQKQLRGSLFALLEIKTTVADKGRSDAQLLFGEFKNKFYQTGGNNLKALEESLLYSEGFVKKENIIANLVVAALWGSVLYVGKFGDGGVLLARKGVSKKIDFTRVASGALFDKDSVFLVDSSFISSVSLAFLEQLAKLAAKDDFEEAVSAIGEEFKKNQENEGTAFCLRLSIQEPIEKPEPILIADLDEAKLAKEEEYTQKLLARREINFYKPLLSKIKSLEINKHFNSAKSAAKENFTKVTNYILLPWRPREAGSIGDEVVRKRQRIAQIVAALVFILVASVIVGVVNHQRGVSKERLESGISLVESKFAQAEELKDISPAEAANLVLEAEEALALLPQDDPTVIQLKERLEILLAAINKIFKVDSKEFADLSLLKGGVRAKYLKLFEKDIYVLDGGTGSVFKVALSGGQPQILISEKALLQNMAASSVSIYLQTEKGVKTVDIVTKVEKDVVGASQSWQAVSDAQTFRNNLYLLDTKARQIWKYVPAGQGISGPITYLDQKLDKEPLSFTIDGSVYVASKDQVLKFLNGAKQPFEIKDLPKAINEIESIYTKENFVNLYILDKAAGGIFVIDKATGAYKALYTSEKLSQAISLVVNEGKKIAYFLVENTIYSVNLK